MRTAGTRGPSHGLPAGGSTRWQEEWVSDSEYRQRAIFFPRGLAGKLYWLSVLPFHGVVFASMARNITRAAERSGRGDGGT